MDIILIDIEGNKITRPKAEKMIKDYMIKEVEEAFDDLKCLTVTFNRGAIVADGWNEGDITLGDLLEKARGITQS